MKHRGRPGKKILCINDGRIYESLISAANQYNISSSAISQTLHEKRRSVKGLYFTTINGCETAEELEEIRKELISTRCKIIV